ncbi:MAG: DUF3883 domain-containing protein [Candidatus Binataceae bacterium]
MGLLNGSGGRILRDQWIRNFQSAAADWKPKQTEAKAKLRYTLLSHMLEIRHGDLLLVPNITESDRRGLVLVTAVSRDRSSDAKCYEWDDSRRPKSHPLGDDRRHVVRVDPFTINAVRYETGSLAVAIRTDLGTLQACVVPVDGKKNKGLVGNVEKLYGTPLSTAAGKKKSTLKTAPKKGHPPTADQLKRGWEGEEEMRRRLESAHGFLGLKFKLDRRNSSDGYDFLCTEGRAEVEVEVKTFSATDGQIFISENELQRAASSKKRYCLFGVFDNGGPPSKWKVRTLRAPSSELNRVGAEQIVRLLRANPHLIEWDD